MSNITPPHSVEAERAVLGGILFDPPSFVNVSNILTKEHFFSETHQLIYEVISELDAKNKSLDILTVSDLTSARAKISASLLSELIDACPVTHHLEKYAEIVKDAYIRRRIIHGCQAAIKRVLAYDGTDVNYLQDVERELLAATESQNNSKLRPITDAVGDAMEELERRIGLQGKLTGVPTGFKDIDAVTGGWQPSDLIILAARPGMGKTALCLNWAIEAARTGYHTAFFSMEMSESQLMMRLLSSDARIISTKMRNGTLDQSEMDLLIKSMRGFHELKTPLCIDDTPAITLSELRSRCRRAKKERGLDVVMLDYLQLMGTTQTSRYSNREREISEISRGLKALAKELNICVISLAQLNRAPDSRPDKRPRMSDLRESGSIEQDADLVMFIYRDDYYHANSDAAGRAELIISKNRHGEMATIELAFLAPFVTFHTIDIDDTLFG